MKYKYNLINSNIFNKIIFIDSDKHKELLYKCKLLV